MVTVPQITATNVPSPSSNRGVSAFSPFAPDTTNRAKAQRFNSLESIFSLASKEYEQRKAKLDAANRVIKGAEEQASAHRKSREILQEVEKMDDLDGAMDYAKEQMDIYAQERMSEYAGADPQLQASVFASLQRTSLTTEDAAFTYLERKKQDQYLATMDQSVAEAKNALVVAPTETMRAQYYQQIDKSLDAAVDLGYLSSQRAGEMKRNARSEAVSAIVRNSLANEATGYAAAYLEANREFLSPEQQASLSGSIINERQRQVNRAERAQTKALMEKLKPIKLDSQGKHGEAAVMRGADRNSRVEIFNDSGGKATMHEVDAKAFVQNVKDGDIPAEEFASYLSQFQQAYGEDMFEVHLGELAKAGMGGGEMGLMMHMATTAQNHPDAVKNMNALWKMARDAESRKATESIFRDATGVTKQPLIDKIYANPTFQKIVQAKRDAGIEPESIDAFAESISSLVMARHSGGDNVDATIKDSIAFVDGKFLVRDDQTIYIPDSTANLNLIEDGIDDWLGNLNPDDFIPPQGMDGWEVKKYFSEWKDNLTVKKYPSAGDYKLYVADKASGVALLQKDGNPVIRSTGLLELAGKQKFDKAMKEGAELTEELKAGGWMGGRY